MIFIGFTGYKQSGKNTVASILAQHIPYFNDCVKFESFAAGVKDEVCKAFDITRIHLEKIKNNPIVRKTLQNVGTEWGRDERGKDIWIKQLDERVQKFKHTEKSVYVFVTDVRFPDEAEYIRNQKGFIVKVERKGQKNTDEHRSETLIDSIQQDYTIYNDGFSLNDLGREVKFLSQIIKEKYGY